MGYTVANRAICAPGSTIKNSRFTGTYRFRRDLRVENCELSLLAMWILEDGGVEGPLPGNLDFINCTFLGKGGIDTTVPDTFTLDDLFTYDPPADGK